MKNSTTKKAKFFPKLRKYLQITDYISFLLFWLLPVDLNQDQKRVYKKF